MSEGPELPGSCHCGAVRITVPGPPEQVTRCNCSLCRKTGWIGGYWHPDQVTIEAKPDALNPYVQGDRMITTWNCATCGSHTHWTPRTAPPDRMGVNMRIFDSGDWQHLPVHKVDGASFKRRLAICAPHLIRSSIGDQPLASKTSVRFGRDCVEKRRPRTVVSRPTNSHVLLFAYHHEPPFRPPDAHCIMMPHCTIRQKLSFLFNKLAVSAARQDVRHGPSIPARDRAQFGENKIMKQHEQKPTGLIHKRIYEKPELVLLSDMMRVEGKPSYTIETPSFSGSAGPS